MTNDNYTPHSDEITLKDLILKIHEFFWEVVKRWYVIFILFILTASYFFFNVYTTPTTYPAKLKFMISDDGGDNSGMNMILGSIGLGGIGQKGQLVGLEKIMQLFKTRAVIDRAMLSLHEKNGKVDLLANHIIEEITFSKLLDDYGPASWSKKLDGFDNFSFSSNTNIDSLKEHEEIILKILYDNIVGHHERELNPMVYSALDENSEIITLSVITETQELSLVLLNAIYNQLSEFFINKAIEKQQKTFDVISYKTDSIKNALRSAEFQLADFKDRNRKLVTVKGYLKETKLEREVNILNVMYAESIRNLEVADFALRRRKPYIQLLDSPMRPLTGIGKSKKKALAYSFLIAVVLGSLIIIIRKIYKDIMSS